MLAVLLTGAVVTMILHYAQVVRPYDRPRWHLLVSGALWPICLPALLVATPRS